MYDNTSVSLTCCVGFVILAVILTQIAGCVKVQSAEYTLQVQAREAARAKVAESVCKIDGPMDGGRVSLCGKAMQQ